MTDRSTRYRAFALGVGGTLLVLALIGLTIVWTGAYNVAATDDHTALGKWAIHTTMENSIKSRAGSIAAPARFTPQQIMAGGASIRRCASSATPVPGWSAKNGRKA